MSGSRSRLLESLVKLLFVYNNTCFKDVRVMEELLDAGDDLILKIETGLRNIREEKEAEIALLLEEEGLARRLMMVEAEVGFE